MRPSLLSVELVRMCRFDKASLYGTDWDLSWKHNNSIITKDHKTLYDWNCWLRVIFCRSCQIFYKDDVEEITC